MDSILDIPGYREAVDNERASRDAAFIDAPESVCGFMLAPLTLRKYMALQAINHPLLRGKIPSPYELIAFLWLMNPEYKISRRVSRAFASAASILIPPSITPDGNGFWSRVRRRKAERVLIESAQVIQGIREWLRDIFIESGGGIELKGFSKEYWSCGVSVVIQLAQEGLGGEQDILDMPMKRIFAYRKYLKRQNNHKEPLFNPSDKILNDYMKSQNRN